MTKVVGAECIQVDWSPAGRKAYTSRTRSGAYETICQCRNIRDARLNAGIDV